MYYINKRDLEGVSNALLGGCDPDAIDYAGNSALIVAAANKQGLIIQLLLKAGANVNCRDKNMMTPLLFSINRGHMEAVRQLLTGGADRTVSDNKHRNCLFHAIYSGKDHIVKFFVTTQNRNLQEEQWGFTPLHLSANLGHDHLVSLFIEYGCSIYIRDDKGRTAEEVARECRQTKIIKMLEAERIGAPAQLAYTHSICGHSLEVWVGDVSALDDQWFFNVNFTDGN